MASETTETLRAAIETALRRRDARAVAMMLVCDASEVDGMIAKSIGASPDEDLAHIAALIGLRDDGSDPAEEVERLREREASHAAEMARVIAVATEGVQRTEREALDHYAAAKRRMEASRDAAAQAFDDLVARVWRAATGDAHKGPASVDGLVEAVTALKSERDAARADLAQLADQQQRLMATIGEQTAEIARLRTDNGRLDDVAKSALDDLARVRAELDEARAALCSYAPRCAGCGDRLAACRGSYEGAPESYACDGCCGHGNEDGHCDPVEHAAAVRAAVTR